MDFIYFGIGDLYHNFAIFYVKLSYTIHNKRNVSIKITYNLIAQNEYIECN